MILTWETVMNTRESDRTPSERRKHRQQMLRKKRRRRRKKILRRIAVTLMTLVLFLLVLLLSFGFAKFLFTRNHDLSAISKEIQLPWNLSFGTVDIVLDAGHGGKDQGASSKDVLEKDINLKIVQKTQKLLEDAGYKVGMVREDDTFVKLGERAEYANKKEAQVFVSIHCNSSESGEGNGIETYYAEEKTENSQPLAQLIQENVILQTNARDREARTADYAVISLTDMPAALVEVGFLSDADERSLLQQDSYQDLLARGIADGIISYLDDQAEE